jgi:hypothetical protein
MVLCLGWIQNPDRGNGPSPRGMLTALPGSPGIEVYQTIMEAIIKRKTATHIMML